MEKISINKNGLGIFKISPKKDVVKDSTVSSNPFGVHFKGNVIQADVFETTKNSVIKESLKEKIANTGKVFKSSIVGGINSFNNALKQKTSGIISFGHKAKESITRAIDFANNYDLGVELKKTFDSIYSSFANINQYSVKNLTKRPVSELESLLKAELSIL